MAISSTLSSNQAFLTSQAPIAYEQESSTPLLDEAACKVAAVFHGVISFEKDLDDTFSSMPANATPTTSLSRTPTTYEMSLADSNELDFEESLLDEICENAQSGKFFELISERRKELSIQKETWRKFIENHSRVEDPSFYASIDEVFNEGRLLRVDKEETSIYVLYDAIGKPRYVIKPVDEDALCLNHPKGLGSPFNDEDHLSRDHIPLYRSAQTDAFCSTLASLCGIGSITPKTVMHVISSESYHDISSLLEGEERDLFLHFTGSPDQEKLCSVQEFVDNSESVHIVQQHSFEEDYDQKDFEEVSFFTWLTGETDGHSANFLTYVKSVDLNGKHIYGLKKIDNTLSFPEKNCGISSILQYSPHACRPLSEEIIKKIRSIPMQQILEKMNDYQLGNTRDAFVERVDVIEELAKREGITIEEIYFRLSLLGREDGKTLALSAYSLSELKPIEYGIINPAYLFETS